MAVRNQIQQNGQIEQIFYLWKIVDKKHINKTNIFPKKINFYYFVTKFLLESTKKSRLLLKSVFLISDSGNRPLIGRPDRSANQRPVLFFRESTWTHVLTRISEKTDFSIILTFTNRNVKGFGFIFHFNFQKSFWIILILRWYVSYQVGISAIFCCTARISIIFWIFA